MKTKTNLIIGSIGLIFYLSMATVFAQTTIKTDKLFNNGCKHQSLTVTLKNPPTGAAGYFWNWGDGNSSSSSTLPFAQHIYSNSGKFIISCTVSGVNQTYFSDTVYVNNLPTAQIVTMNGNKFCNGQAVCFQDNSKIALPLSGRPVAPLIKRLVLHGDGSKDGNPLSVKNFCYTYPSPDYNVYTITMVVTDATGCTDTIRKPNHIYIVGNLKAKYSFTAPEGCKQTPIRFHTDAFFLNQTRSEILYPDSVKLFSWLFGDGTVDSVAWQGVPHRYSTNGAFSPRLFVEDINGCKDTFTINGAVRNTSFAFNLHSIVDSACANPGIICWKQTPVAGATRLWEFWISPNPKFNPSTGKYFIPSGTGWQPLSPDPKVFTEDASFEPCRNIPCGLARVRLKITAPGCKDSTWFWDTVEVLGPDAHIEVAGISGYAVADSMRYQCKVVNTVHFPNNSCHYKAFHVQRLWNFGDKYARQCTTDTKNGINVNGNDTLSLLDPVKYPPGSSRPCNCNFSVDSLPSHSYTDWDTLALSAVNGFTFIQPNQPPYSTKNFPEYKAKLMLYDSVNKCGDTDSILLFFGPPKAGPADASITPSGHTKVVLPHVNYNDPITLKRNGIMCFGAAPNGIIFDLSGLQPSTSRSHVSINFDSAAGINSSKWTTQAALFKQLNNQSPWNIPASPKQWPNSIAKNYYDPPGLADTNGWITIGIVAGNGYGNNRCYDTAYYHNFLRLTPFTPAWDIVDKLPSGQVKNFGMRPFTLRGSLRKNYQDSILAIVWNWQDGWVDVDSILRLGYVRNNLPPVPSYQRIRYKINPQGTVVGQLDVSHLPSGDVGSDTLSHTYVTNGRYYPNVSLLTISGCVQFSIKEIGVGNNLQRSVNDTVVCTGDSVLFLDSANYYIMPEPIFPPYYLRMGRDPYLGGYRKTLPVAPYVTEEIYWDIYKRRVNGTDSFMQRLTGPLKKHAFAERGLYIIKMLVRDSTNNIDTAQFPMRVNVVGVDAGIYTVKNPFDCDDTIQLYDSSVVFDAFKTLYGQETDQIKPENQNGYYWELGDGKANSPLKNPYHEYTSNGTFRVMHVVTTIQGCTDTVYKNISINGKIPLFDFKGDSIGKAPFKVTIDNKSTGTNFFYWYFGDYIFPEITDNDSNMTHTYNEPGEYCIYLAASNVNDNCKTIIYPDSMSPLFDKRCVKVLVDSVKLDVLQPDSKKSISVYPNPATNTLTIESPSDIVQSEICILDILGRKWCGVKPVSVKSRQCTISIEHLKQGAYLLELKSGETIYHLRFIKN